MYQRVKYFLKAAETGSFSAAARELFVSAQALSKQVEALEKELGASLFCRSPQGIQLTGFGQIARTELSRVMEDTNRVMKSLQQYAARTSAHLSIGIFSALPRKELVSPVVSFFLASYPEYQMNLEMQELEEGYRKLASGELDLLLTGVHEQQNTRGYGRLAFEVFEAKVLVSYTHPWFMKDRVSKEDLEQETFLKLSSDGERYQMPRERDFFLKVPHKKLEEVANFSTLMMLLGQGKGFTVLPLNFDRQEHTQIKTFDYPGKSLTCYTALLYKKEQQSTAFGQIISDIKEEFDLFQI